MPSFVPGIPSPFVPPSGGLWPEPGLADFTEFNGRRAARQCCWPGVARARCRLGITCNYCSVEYLLYPYLRRTSKLSLWKSVHNRWDIPFSKLVTLRTLIY